MPRLTQAVVKRELNQLGVSFKRHPRTKMFVIEAKADKDHTTYHYLTLGEALENGRRLASKFNLLTITLQGPVDLDYGSGLKLRFEPSGAVVPICNGETFGIPGGYMKVTEAEQVIRARRLGVA